MRFRSKALLVAGIGLSFIAVTTIPAMGADTANSEFVIIPADDTFSDDLYAGAISVVVDGTIDGDLVAFAGEEVVINGTVTGSVVAMTPRVVINGTVEGSVRATGSSLEVSGHVGRDVVAAVISAELFETSRVDGDVLIWAWKTSATGQIGSDFTGSMRTLEIAGEVEGDIDVSVSSFEVIGDLAVGGDLGYRSKSDAKGLELADVDGAIVHKTPLAPNLRVRALGLMGRFMVVLFLSAGGLAVAYGWPERTERAVAVVGSKPVRAWTTGAVILLSPVGALLLTALIFNLAPAAAAFPLLAILVPVVLALFGIVFALAFVAGIPMVGWIGGIAFKKLDLYGAILVGGLGVGLAWYLPVVGFLVPVLVLPVGLGAWIGSRCQAETATEA